jgi:3-dehydroquinate dehydratase-1
MTSDRFTLAATTNDLTREQEVRGVADAVEFRMDKADHPVAQLSEYTGELPIVATNRGKWFGGQANDTGRLDRLFEVSEFEAVEMVDIELETVRGTSWVLEEFRENDVEIIVSSHGFEDTPDVDTLLAIFEQGVRHGDIAKVAAFAEDYSDAVNMLEAVHTATASGLRVAGISMGGVGSHTRVVAPLYGSELGYAPLASDTNSYAPGQIPIRRLATTIETLEASEGGYETQIDGSETVPVGTTTVEEETG